MRYFGESIFKKMRITVCSILNFSDIPMHKPNMSDFTVREGGCELCAQISLPLSAEID